MRAGRIGIQQSRANEITAFLRPNPEISVILDQLTPTDRNPYYRPLSEALPIISGSYLIERQHKRSLRLQSAQQGTAIATSDLADQERNLLFNLRNAFIQTLQQKAVLAVTRASLEFYDHMLDVNRDRYGVGDIAQVDLQRLELQRVQFITDVQTALVNLRTAKIQLLAILNDRTPVEQLDVVGNFDFQELVTPLEELRRMALENRPDLRAALESVDKAKADHRLAVANGSTDPIVESHFAHDPDFHNYVGLSVTIPLRIFDRNQGEKARTQLDIRRNERLVDANRAAVFSDVDSAYATLESNLVLLRPYKTTYLAQAANVRETISYSYQRGSASLLDYFQAQQDYRVIQLSYLDLVGAYLSAASQLNFAVGLEVIK